MSSVRSIQVMRGMAAAAVAFYHTFIIAQQSAPGQPVVWESFATHGFLGVNFFFVLSGFIILMAHINDIGNKGALLPYLRKRVVRIYPAYWIFSTLYIVAAAIGLGTPDFSWAPLDLLSSYLLLQVSPERVVPPLRVAWTLFYEIQFYLLFASIIFSIRIGLIVFAAWVISICVGVAIGVHGADIRIMSPWNMYFFAGMLSFWLYKRDLPSAWIAALIGALAIFGYYFLHFSLDIHELSRQYGYLHFLLAPAFGLFIYATVSIERRLKISPPRILLYLGDASYSIYLVHSAVISLAVIVFRKIGLQLHASSTLFLVVFISSVAAGCLAYSLVEKPVTQYLRKVVIGSRELKVS